MIYFLKNRTTVARKTDIMKIIKTLTDYIQLKNFKLSAVRLQSSMDKMEKIGNYLAIYKKVRLIKKIFKNGRLKNMYESVNCSFLKDGVLVGERP